MSVWMVFLFNVFLCRLRQSSLGRLKVTGGGYMCPLFVIHMCASEGSSSPPLSVCTQTHQKREAAASVSPSRRASHQGCDGRMPGTVALGRTAVTAAVGSDRGQTWQVPAREEKTQVRAEKLDEWRQGRALKGDSMRHTIFRPKKLPS